MIFFQAKSFTWAIASLGVVIQNRYEISAVVPFWIILRKPVNGSDAAISMDNIYLT